jgi:hypothetical protein
VIKNRSTRKSRKLRRKLHLRDAFCSRIVAAFRRRIAELPAKRLDAIRAMVMLRRAKIAKNRQRKNAVVPQPFFIGGAAAKTA